MVLEQLVMYTGQVQGLYGDICTEAAESTKESTELQKELKTLKAKTDADQKEQAEVHRKIRGQLELQFEEYLSHKDSDTTTRGELHLIRCLYHVAKEAGETLDSESRDVLTTITEGVMSQMEERLNLLYLPHSEIIDRFRQDDV